MSHREYTEEQLRDMDVLQKAIDKAIHNGWNEALIEDEWHIHPGRMAGRYDMCVPKVDLPVYHCDAAAVIFDHGFAKAIWSEIKPLENGEYPPEAIMYKGKPMWEPWKYYLQQMVIAENPIKYLGEHLQ